MLRLALASLMSAALPLLALAPALAAQPLQPAASSQPAQVARPASDADALRMLVRASEAAQSIAYRGTYVHQRGNDVATLRVTHQRQGTLTLEKRERLDGSPVETVRRGEQVLSYLPQQRLVRMQGREQGPAFPGLQLPDRARLNAHYRLRWLGDDQVAGRAASACELEPRDALRYGYRFWIDKATGLLLRVQTISEKSEVIEQAAFTQLSVGAMPLAQLKASVRDTRGWQVDDASGRAVHAHGWQARWLPAGFSYQGAWLRSVPVAGARDGERREVLQLLYSDGLAGVSVFIEPWSAERSIRPLRLGALNMVGKRHGKFWLTIVGEIPMVAIRQVADAIEFTEAARK